MYPFLEVAQPAPLGPFGKKWRFFLYLHYCTTSQLQTISTLSLISYSVLHDLWSNIPGNILTLDVHVPVYSAYKNLVISSIGLSRFSLLGSSFSSRTGMSSLGCVINFSRYLVLWLVISALTVGICRSLCITVEMEMKMNIEKMNIE